MIISAAFGTALASSLIVIGTRISADVAKELRAFGANIRVEPRVEGLAEFSGQIRYLQEADLQKIKTIFWRHNIVDIAPFLERPFTVQGPGGSPVEVTAVGTWFEHPVSVPGDSNPRSTGMKALAPWWELEGAWPPEITAGRLAVVLGVDVARQLDVTTGMSLAVEGHQARITGIISTGGKEDGQLYMNLADLQAMTGLQGKISKVLVSALCTPMDEFAYKDPATMSRSEYEKWYCTGYATSIAKQIEEVMSGSVVTPVWRVAETEGRVLRRLTLLFVVLSILCLLASAMSVGTTMVSSLVRRVEEVGLMKALGADTLGIVTLFVAEASIIGIAGGFLGFFLSLYTARWIGLLVFGTTAVPPASLAPVAVGAALVITVIGSLLPVVNALRIQPAVILKNVE